MGQGASTTDITVPLQESGDEVGWWLYCSRRRMDAFAAAWEARPPGVVWYGSERARRLLAGNQRVAPRVRIDATGVDWFTVSTAWEAEGRRRCFHL